LSEETSAAISRNDDNFPVKWTAIEVLQGGAYSHKSDCWSFGILCWEIMEKGAAPFYWMNNEQAKEAITSGERLPKPDDCPDGIYKLMLKTWNVNPEARPSFKELLLELQKIYTEFAPAAETRRVNSIEIDADTYVNGPKSDKNIYNTEE